MNISFKIPGYKVGELKILNFKECYLCGHTIILTETVKDPFKTIKLDPKLDENKEYHLHVCQR